MTACEPRRLHAGDILKRTAEGTRQMSTRDSHPSPKLRSVLFLVTGRATVAALETSGLCVSRGDGSMRAL